MVSVPLLELVETNWRHVVHCFNRDSRQEAETSGWTTGCLVLVWLGFGVIYCRMILLIARPALLIKSLEPHQKRKRHQWPVTSGSALVLLDWPSIIPKLLVSSRSNFRMKNQQSGLGFEWHTVGWNDTTSKKVLNDISWRLRHAGHQQ